MISKEDLKNKLLKTDMFIDNISFNNYLDLIIKNLNTPKIKDQTQKHHIIPRYYFNHRNLPVDDSKENLVNVPIKDHALIHYYLYQCVKDTKEKYSNLYALRRMLGGMFENISDIESLDAEECLKLYKDYCEYNRQAHLGTTHVTSDETRKKIGASNKGKYHDYVSIHNDMGEEKRIPESDLIYYLDGGWNLGRSPRSIDSLKKGYNHEVKGMLGKAQSDYQKEQARKALFGKPKSDVAKNNMSLARKGKKLYIDPESGKGKYLSPDEIESYEKLGWSKK